MPNRRPALGGSALSNGHIALENCTLHDGRQALGDSRLSGVRLTLDDKVRGDFKQN